MVATLCILFGILMGYFGARPIKGNSWTQTALAWVICAVMLFMGLVALAYGI